MRNEERDVYVIPPNFIEGGTLLGGMFKTRNVIEAGVLGLLGRPARPQFRDFPHYASHHPLLDGPAAGVGRSYRHFRQQPIRFHPPILSLPAEPQSP